VVSIRKQENYNELVYNPKLKEQARLNRKAGILGEVLLWQKLKNGKINNLDFDRQKIIGNYIVDFYCSEAKIVIEVDGSSHDSKQEYDENRDNYLQSLGLKVIHITDKDVKNKLNDVVAYLLNHPACSAGTPPKEGN